MSQAFNLSQFANKVNTSGQADLTTAVTGTLPQGNGGTGLTTPGTSGNVLMSNGTDWVSGTIYATRNRIINGAMVIDQRNAGASGTGNGEYTVDRWFYQGSQSSKLTWQQNAGSVTPPVGFSNYFGFTSSSAYSVAAGDYFYFQQPIEGYNVADLGFGTANAKTITLSFWVRSSLTGTFGGAIQNGNSTRTYPFSYTISSANTWTQISITVAGDTTGTWLTTNGHGLSVFFSLGMGSTYSGTANTWSSTNYISTTGATSVVGTNGATWYVTGVQLEQGSTATPFERRLISQELANCQRYYSIFWVGVDWITNGYASHGVTYPVTMRASPTVTAGSGPLSSNISVLSIPVGAYGGTSGTTFQGASTTASSRAYYFNYYTASAEL